MYPVIIHSPDTIGLGTNYGVPISYQEQLIKSEFFLKYLKIIVKQSNHRLGKQVIEIFENLYQDKMLTNIQKEIVYTFIKDDRVSFFIKNLLEKINKKFLISNIQTSFTDKELIHAGTIKKEFKEKIHIKGHIEDIDKIITLIDFIEGVFSNNGYKKIQRYIGEFADITSLIIENIEEEKIFITNPY